MSDISMPRGSLEPGAAEALMKIATGFMASKYLFAGAELGIFEHLARGAPDLGALAARVGAPARTGVKSYPLKVMGSNIEIEL
jgi:Dimerisation domain